MTPVKTTSDLASVITDVLGGLAFMVNDDERVAPPPGAVWLRADVTYRGPLSGTITCWCTREFAVQLTANVLGLETDDDSARDHAADGLREFMNVLCGQFVTAWHGHEAIFDLTIPTVCECPEQPRIAGQPGDLLCQLAIADEPLHCRFRPQH